MESTSTTDSKITIASNETTQPEAEQTGTTPPDAESSGATPPAAAESGTFDQEAVEKIVRNRLTRERKKWEQEREEAAERARMSEQEKLEADLANRDARIAELEAELVSLRRSATLTGRVRDVNAAMKLIEEKHLDENGAVIVEAFLEDYPFMRLDDARPSARSASAPAPVSGAPATNPFAKETLNLSEQARLLRENPSLAASLQKQARN